MRKCFALILVLWSFIGFAYAKPIVDTVTSVAVPDGTSTNPSISFQNERTLGFYHPSSGVMGLTGDILQPASSYHNYGSTSGILGYGFRDVNGVMQFRNSAGNWTGFTAAAAATTFDEPITLSQVNAPTAPTAVVNAVAGNLNGTYVYRVTYVTATGETEAGEASSTVTPNNQQVNLTNIPVSVHPDVTTKKIYRNTSANSNQRWRLLNLVATIDNATESYTDNVLDADLGAVANTVNTTGAMFYYNTVRSGLMDTQTTAWGYQALEVNQGFENSAFGLFALRSNTTGFINSAFGSWALQANTTGYFNSAFGQDSLRSNTTGYYNSAFGVASLRGNISGIQNVAVGRNALNQSTTASYNVALGMNSMYSATEGGSNTAIGEQSMFSTTTGIENVAIGRAALYSNLTTNYNIAIGKDALYSATASSNLAIGRNSLYDTTTGTFNIAIGNDSMSNNTLGGNNISIGVDSMLTNVIGNYNVALGVEALYTNNSDENVAVGYKAMKYNDSGVRNTATGTNSLRSNTQGDSNSAFGSEALYSNTTADYNSAFGRASLYANTTGYENSAFGKDTLTSNVTGYGNLAGGMQALYSNVDGNYNVGLGRSALFTNSGGDNNTAVGRDSLYTNSIGNENTAIGKGALYSSVSDYNTAVGVMALESNAAGHNNSAVGRNALKGNTTGNFNNAFGTDSGLSTTIGYDNNSFGSDSLYSNVDGYRNVAVGSEALYDNISGHSNVALGYKALADLITGNNNVGVGPQAGKFISGGVIANTSSTTSIYLGTDTKALADGDTNETVIGYDVTGAGSNTVSIGNSSVTKTILRGQVFIEDSANANSVVGLTINQEANDDEIISLKATAVGHSFTDDTEVDTFAFLKKLSGSGGGLAITGLSDGDATGIRIRGAIGSADPTDTVPAIILRGNKLSTNTFGALGSSETLLQIQNHTSAIATMLASGNFGIGQVTPIDKIHLTSASGDLGITIQSPSNSNSYSNFLEQLTPSYSGGRVQYDGTNNVFEMHTWAAGVAVANRISIVRDTGEVRIKGVDNDLAATAFTVIDENDITYFQVASTGLGANDKGRVFVFGNMGINTSTFGSNAVNVIGLKSGTEPTDAPADVTQIGSFDAVGAGTAVLSVFQEYAPYAGVGVASTHKIPIRINNVTYYILATTVQ